MSMSHNGYLVHPDIWMLWFSFFVACGVTTYAVGRAAYWLVRMAILTWVVNR